MKWPTGLVAHIERPATDADIAAFVGSVFAPLSNEEISNLLVEHKAIVGDGGLGPPFDPRTWVFPQFPLPDSYLSFLRYSNGGYFAGVNRDFDPLFNTQEVRDYMLCNGIPHWMPSSCPIGFDGGGTFYLLDMRQKSDNGDYPVLFAHAGNLGYDEAITLAHSFEELIASQLGKV